MRSKEYRARYICPECYRQSWIASYGMTSDIMRAISSLLNQPFCVDCARLKKKIRMDVLRVECKIHKEIEQKYLAAWRCSKCYSSWSTRDQLTNGENFTDIGINNKKPRCINVSCNSIPEDIRMISIERKA
jgi:hypothetical protein